MRAGIARRSHDDRGSMMVEALVALVIATTVIASVASMFVASAASRTGNEGRDKANEMLNQTLERARQVTWPQLGVYVQDGASAGTVSGENRVVLSGTLPPARLTPTKTESVGNVSYTISTDVRWMASAADNNLARPGLPATPAGNPGGVYSAKRVVVTVTWTVPGKQPRSVNGQIFRSPDAAEQAPARVGGSIGSTCDAALASPGCSITVTGGNTFTPVGPTGGGSTTPIVASMITVRFTDVVNSVTARDMTTGRSVSLVSPNGGRTWVYTVAAGSANPFFGIGATTIQVSASLVGGGAWSATVPAVFYQPQIAAPAALKVGPVRRLASAASVTGQEPAVARVCVNSATGRPWYDYGWVVDAVNFDKAPTFVVITSSGGQRRVLSVLTPSASDAVYNASTGQVVSGPTAPSRPGLFTYRRAVVLPSTVTLTGSSAVAVGISAQRNSDGVTPAAAATAVIQSTSSSSACS